MLVTEKSWLTRRKPSKECTWRFSGLIHARQSLHIDSSDHSDQSEILASPVAAVAAECPQPNGRFSTTTGFKKRKEGLQAQKATAADL